MDDGFLLAGTHIESLASAAGFRRGGDLKKFEHYAKRF